MSEQCGFCHACCQGFVEIDNGLVAPAPEQEPSCPLCGSDFVELSPVATSTGPGGTVSNQSSSSTTDAPQAPAGMSLYTHPGATVAVRLSHFENSNLAEVLESIIPHIGELSGGLRMGDFFFGSALDRIADQLADVHEPVRTPADPAVVAGLPRRRLTESQVGPNSTLPSGGSSTIDKCAVCHEDYCAGEEVLDLPCGHHFHSPCISPWLCEHNTCPVCRQVLPSQATNLSTQNEDMPDLEMGSEPVGDATMEGNVEMALLPREAAEAEEEVLEEEGHMVTGSDGGEDGGVARFSDTQLAEAGGAEESDQSNGSGEISNDLQRRIHGAENELDSLQRRLAVQLSEHERLQVQIQDLQIRRSELQAQFEYQNAARLRLRLNEMAERAGGLSDAQRVRAESLFSRVTHRIRQVLGRTDDAEASRGSVELGDSHVNNSDGGSDGM